MMKGFKAVLLLCLACLSVALASKAFAKESRNDPYFSTPIKSAQADAVLRDPGEDSGVIQDISAPAALEEPASEEAGEENAKGLPQFDPTSFTSQLFWLAITFAVLYVFFSNVTLPQVAQVQKKRAAHIDHDMASAQRMRESAEVAKARYESAVAEAQMKATELYMKANEDVKQKMTSGIEDFKKRSAKNVQQTEALIDKSKKEAIEAIQTIAAEIASLAAEKIVGVSTDIDDAKTVVRNINKKAA